ncbi:MAG TPA: flagellar hook-basal body complex protein [Candidatus Competibacteraceae bacterium]|nr:flagellar hook-basal body complex protein [Candidatus Competibacteraceae bacterium]MCP5132246.1 flagellar hook-basal body complex protein [Gammaproteobacteria bacterium]HPF59204.1 flagellar hook-basal body complex protein [Candidatus Competibacteraceae bacterium]HRY17660.1 flagellar hook-basal body complex protein [Candidatus Competibacteraceae bacterium]
MSLNIALTGINAANADLGVVSDNIANANTTGFKKARAEFGDLVDSMSAQGGGLGVRLQRITQTFQQGSVETTGNTFDMAVVGDGFFQVNDGQEVFFTRAGSFRADTQGYIVNNLLQNVQGYTVQVSPPTASSEVALGLTLDGSGLINAPANFDANDPLTYNHATAITVYDSAGFTHTLRSYFLKTAVNAGPPATTDWQIYHKVDNNPSTIDGGVINFDNTTGAITATPTFLSITGVDLGTGADTMTLNLNYDDLTQGSSFSIVSFTANGSLRSREITSIVDDLQIDSSTMQPKMTGTVDLGINLNSSEEAPVPTATVEYTASLGGGSTPINTGATPFDPTDPTTYHHVNSQQIYDSLGVNHTLQTYFTLTTTANTWEVHYTLNNTIPIENNGGTILFASGRPDLTNVTTPITFATAELGSGATALTITPDFSKVLEVAGTTSETMSVIATSPSANPSTIDATDIRNYDYSTALSIYDSLGIDHTLNLYFRKTADNLWSVYRQFTDVESIATRIGSVAFDSRGLPTQAADETGYIDPDEPLMLRMPSVSFGNGAGRQNIELNFGDTTQFDSESITNSLSQDGYTMGQLSKVDADELGNVIASYSNGETQIMGQVVLARFANTQGLKRQGDNNWIATRESGPAIIGKPGNGSLGKIVVGALESSNVELTKELVDMISAQRSFQANAQVINTTGTLYQAILSIR